MSFNPNIPLPTDFLSQSQQDILTNFQTSDTSQGVNHYPYSDVTANNGKHKFVQMPENAAPVTAVDEGAVYTKVGVGPAETNLWFRAEDSGGGGGFEYQLTRVDAANSASFAASSAAVDTAGWTFLPGGLLLQYGYRGVAANGTATTITFPRAFTTAVYSITIGNVTAEGNSPSANNQFISQASVSTTSFNVVNSSSSAARRVYWMAIGL